MGNSTLKEVSNIAISGLTQLGLQEQGTALSQFLTQERIASFKGACEKGLQFVATACDGSKELLPIPGGPAVALLGIVTQGVLTAVQNKDNLERLVRRSADLMDVIIEKHGPVSLKDQEAKQDNSRAAEAGGRMYCQLMEKFRDLLNRIKAYTDEYQKPRFLDKLVKLINAGSDREQYERFVDELATLLADAHFSVSVKTHSRVTEVLGTTKETKEMLAQQVRRETQYEDHSEEIKSLVEKLGGADAVAKDDAKLVQVVTHLDLGHQIMIGRFETILKSKLQAESDKGPHKIIKHPDMRAFWRQFFTHKEEAKWLTWWEIFPSGLAEVVYDNAEVEQVAAMLPGDGEDADVRKKRFEMSVEKEDEKTVSIVEVNRAFPYGISLSEAVERAIRRQEDRESEASATASGSGGTLSVGHTSSEHVQQESFPSGKRGRCALPEFDKGYEGREQDALALVHAFQQQLHSSRRKAAVCIVAGPGMGKSSLSLEVGWRMAKAGMCPAGAVLVDMREASTFEAAIGRMCSALDLQPDEYAAQRIKTNLKSRQRTWGGRLLMLLDNAEDPICTQEGAQLTDFLDEVAELAALLITSRQPVAEKKDMQQYKLSSMSDAACQRLMRTFAPHLEDSELRQAVTLCGGVPLLVRRAADALQTRQIVLQDLHDEVNKAAPGDRASAGLSLTIRTLPYEDQQHLARLSVFPSNFSVAGAAAVLGSGWDDVQANALLSNLCRHGLVVRGSGAKPFSLHMAVRGASKALGGDAVAQGQAGYVSYMFQELNFWADLFFGRAWETPLALAREATPDILVAFELAGALAAQQTRPQAGMLQSILAADAFLVQELLSCAGLSNISSNTWKKLERLHESITGCSGEEKAAALLLKSVPWSVADYDSAALAYDLCCQALGSDHPRSIDCVHTMAEVQVKSHRYKEAESLFRRAYETGLKVRGKRSPATYMSLLGLARTLGLYQKRHAAAVPVWSEALEVMQQNLGEDHPSTLRAKQGLATSLRSQGKLAEAEVLMRECLASRQRIIPDHPFTLSSANSLALCLMDQNKLAKLAEAEALFRQNLASRQRVLGPNDPDTLKSAQNLEKCIKRRAGKTTAAGGTAAPAKKEEKREESKEEDMGFTAKEEEKKESEEQEKPSRLNAFATGHGVEIGTDGCSARYMAVGRSNNDAGSVMSDKPVPRDCGLYYYEVLVVDQGTAGAIGIGFADANFKLTSMPGWEANSYGYHGDDGRKFSSGRGGEFGPTFGTGDVIGAGIHLGQVFFTKNGSKLGLGLPKPDASGRLGAMRQLDWNVQGVLYPVIGMHSKNESVRVNFQGPFKFEIEDLPFVNIMSLPPTPHIVGARGGNFDSVGAPRGGDQYYCKKGKMPTTEYRLLVELDGVRSDPGMPLKVTGSDMYEAPRIWFYTHQDKPITGVVVLQANSGKGWRDVQFKNAGNERDICFTDCLH